MQFSGKRAPVEEHASTEIAKLAIVSLFSTIRASLMRKFSREE